MVIRAIFVLLLLMPASASAHASMASLYATSGPHLIDVGYDPEFPKVGQRFLIDIALREGSETGPVVDFDSVWVRMSQERKTYFASGIAQSLLGPTTMVITLPEAAEGPMTLSMRFEKDGEAIAEHDFEGLVVAPAPDPFSTREYMMLATLIALFAVITFMVARRYAQAGERDAILKR